MAQSADPAQAPCQILEAAKGTGRKSAELPIKQPLQLLFRALLKSKQAVMLHKPRLKIKVTARRQLRGQTHLRNKRRHTSLSVWTHLMSNLRQSRLLINSANKLSLTEKTHLKKSILKTSQRKALSNIKLNSRKNNAQVKSRVTHY